MDSGGKIYTLTAALWPARKMLLLLIPVFILDLAMVTISIIAYVGAQTGADRPALQRAYIRFTSTGSIVQIVIIAMASLNVFVHPAIATMLLIRIGRVRRSATKEQSKRMQRFMLCVLPYFVVLTLGWTICVALQATYVPIIDDAVLSSCHAWGAELIQCPMVSTTWIGGMIYIIMFITLCVFGGMTAYRLQFLVLDTTHVYQPAAHELELGEPPAYRARPPSYRASDMEGKASSFGLPGAAKAEVPEDRGPLMRTLHEAP